MINPLIQILHQLPPTTRRVVACACAERAVRTCAPDPAAAALIEALAVAHGSPAACLVAWQAVLGHPWSLDGQGAARRWAWRAVWWACFPWPDYTADAAATATWMARRALAVGIGDVGSACFTATLTTEAGWQLGEARRYLPTAALAAVPTFSLSEIPQNGGTLQ